VFNGDRNSFATWLIGIHAFAVSYGFATALKEETANLPEREDSEPSLTTAAGRAQVKDREKNSLAMSYLVHALKGETLLRFIIGCQTEEWPGGRAWVLMKKLRRKYAPEDLTAVAEFKLALKQVKFGKPTDDPDKMFDQLAKIQNKFTMAKVKIDWNDVVATVIGVMPEKYQMLLVKYATKMDNTQDTYEELEAEISQYYRQMQATDEKAKIGVEETEVSLVQFKGRCFNCKKPGHKATECPNCRQEGQTCRECRKKGHTESKCWLKNPSKQPEWYKRQQEEKEKREAAASQTDGSANIEVLVCSTDEKLTFPYLMEMLNDPNIFVADSGATTHSTGHWKGLFETKNATEGQQVMGANGKTEKIKNIGKLRGTFCDKFGSKVIVITLDNVHYVPNQAINLFSLTKAMNNGWTVHGNDDGISISKGDLKINFDIKIPTAKGFLMAGYINRKAVEMAVMNVPRRATKSAMVAHTRLEHSSKTKTKIRKTKKALKQEEMGMCETGMVAIAKQKIVVKDNKNVPMTMKLAKQKIVKDNKDVPTTMKLNERKNSAAIKKHLNEDNAWQLMVVESTKPNKWKQARNYEIDNGETPPSVEAGEGPRSVESDAEKSDTTGTKNENVGNKAEKLGTMGKKKETAFNPILGNTTASKAKSTTRSGWVIQDEKANEASNHIKPIEEENAFQALKQKEDYSKVVALVGADMGDSFTSTTKSQDTKDGTTSNKASSLGDKKKFEKVNNKGELARMMKQKVKEKTNSNPTYKVTINGQSDENWATDPGMRRIDCSENSSDILTKNLPGPAFEKHARVYCGNDEYMQYAVRGEGVGTE
jgi:hypothetical protein